MSNICPPVTVDMDTYSPLKYGLLSIVKPFPELDPHWQTCGVQYESFSCADANVFINVCSNPATKATGQTPTLRSAAPFTIYSSWDCAAGGQSPEEHQRRAENALRCSLEREIESAFYNGTTENTPKLVGGGCTALNTTGSPVSLPAGIGMLEAAMGGVQCGEGALHLPRELGALSARFNQTYGSGNMLRSAMGTPMAFGSGYGNKAPDGTVPPAGISWIYATGPVYAELSSPFMTPPDFDSAFNRSNNRVKWIAEQIALLSVDSCACFAVAVTTTQN